MKNLHTPAPWEIEGTTKRGNPHIITAGKKGWVIAEITNQELGGKYDLTPERSEANARLIAAAPELLEACQSVLDKWHSKSSNFHKKEPEYLDTIRKAIQKATTNV